MRAHNRYSTPVSAGVDPQGFRAGLRQFVDQRYAIVASSTFDAAVKSAVRRLRLSHLPVALIVDAGQHAWVLTGFTATADPAVTSAFRVLSVRIVGPLFGRQSKNGYDPPPNTSMSVDSFRRFLLPFRFPFGATPVGSPLCHVPGDPGTNRPNSRTAADVDQVARQRIWPVRRTLDRAPRRTHPRS